MRYKLAYVVSCDGQSIWKMKRIRCCASFTILIIDILRILILGRDYCYLNLRSSYRMQYENSNHIIFIWMPMPQLRSQPAIAWMLNLALMYRLCKVLGLEKCFGNHYPIVIRLLLRYGPMKNSQAPRKEMMLQLPLALLTMY